MILLQIKLTKLKLDVLKSNFQRKKKDINTNRLAINLQNFALVRFQLKFAFTLRALVLKLCYNFQHEYKGLKKSKN